VSVLPLDQLAESAPEHLSVRSRYNKTDHPVAFHRGELLFAGKKGTQDKPDLDEAFGVSGQKACGSRTLRLTFSLQDDDEEDFQAGGAGAIDEEDAETPDPNADLGKDKLIKVPKAKKPAKSTGKEPVKRVKKE
jgi:hypothetical protein